MFSLKKELENTFALPFEEISEHEWMLRSVDEEQHLIIYINGEGFNVSFEYKIKSEYMYDRFLNILNQYINDIKSRKYLYKVYNKEHGFWEDFSGFFETKEEAIDWYNRKGKNWEQKGYRLKLSTTNKEIEK
jgi:hypothetical protein